ncbi:MAG TPA: hypothetical protein VM925_12615 [Labilithrix sp.]|nr:hypothetical protein [Labilithrix sp.]
MDPPATSTANRGRAATLLQLVLASAFGAVLSALVVASCFDRDERDRREERGALGDAAPPVAPHTRTPEVGTSPATRLAPPTPANVEPPAPAAPPQESTRAERGGVLDGGVDEAATAAAPLADEDAGVTAEPAADAGPPRESIAAGSNPFAPSMSAGAGAFNTEAPPWSASAMTPNLDAGAGRFTTEAPPFGASAMTASTTAGAGPFTTERNMPPITGGPVILLPLVPVPPGAPGALGVGVPQTAGVFAGGAVAVTDGMRGGVFAPPSTLSTTAPTFGAMFGAPSPAGWPTTR